MKFVCGLILIVALTACQAQGTATALRAPATPTVVPSVTPGRSTAFPAQTQSVGNRLTLALDYGVQGQNSPPYYGTNGWWSDQDEVDWKRIYSAFGGNLVRVQILQQQFEPTNDNSDPKVINWNGFLFDQPLPWYGQRKITYRDWFIDMKRQNITLLLSVTYLAGWLGANGDQGYVTQFPPRSVPEYEEFIRALLTFVVDDVGYDPHKVILEPINEPDLPCGFDPNVSCFWNHWDMEQLVDILRSARRAAKEIDPAIRIIGVAECCGTAIAEKLVQDYDGSNLLDGFSFHKYTTGENNFEEGTNRANLLTSFGKPVFLDEYGDTSLMSDGERGAMWHARFLTHFWGMGVIPVQFSIAEQPGFSPGYNALGLVKDWLQNWEIKPAFWVYSHFYYYFGGGTILAVDPLVSSVSTLASRKEIDGQATVAVWINNTNAVNSEKVRIEVTNFIPGKVHVKVLDNFVGPDSTVQESIMSDIRSGITVEVPAYRSYCVVFQAVK